MSAKSRKKDALLFHSDPVPGKIEVSPTKPLTTQRDLALAYSPGVAEPCLEIAKNPTDVYQYTAKGNLVGVISNGTAVLGLGNIGPEASKPVMEGKGVLFKKFAGIDVFDIEVAEENPDAFIKIVRALEPTFGGINLEDIKAPESFQIERELREQMNIPVMHDDQHGTAIISSAALLNALIVVGKKIDEVKVVVNGAGGAAISCTDLYVKIGVKRENIIMLDSRGVLRKDRNDLNEMKSRYATDRDVTTLDEAIKGADMFLGLSMGNVLSPDNLLSMSDDPIVFALANPTPEIAYDLAMSTRPDVVMATGRSDHPNQVNNVLGFPYIFRGALDVRATTINEEMKLAAVTALSELAKQSVPDLVSKAYGGSPIKFGKEYLIPKPLDPRLISTISPAVAKAAMDSDVADLDIYDWEHYKAELEERVGAEKRILARIISQAKKSPKRIVFAEADNLKILKAVQMVRDEGIAVPVLLGNVTKIEKLVKENELDLDDCEIIDPFYADELRAEYGKLLYEKRKRKGISLYEGESRMLDRNYFGAMMVEVGAADALISGLLSEYAKCIRPALQIIGVDDEVERVGGMYIIRSKKGTFFLADTSVNIDPTAEQLVDIIGLSARAVRFFDFEPKMAVLSYSNFGSPKGEVPSKTSRAVEIAKVKWPELKIDGEVQANVALNKKLMSKAYPFSELAGENVNTLIFPDLTSSNIAYNLLMEIGGSEAIGPILMGMKKPVHILQNGSSARDIFNMAAIAVVDAQTSKHN
ncbi:MAG: NADP-dependent malic enzyme [Cyclobacteriaceae bacterium]